MAAETFELYSLTSKLTLDTSQFDRAYGQSQTKMRALAGDSTKLGAAMKTGSAGTDDFGGALRNLLPNLTALGGPAGAIGIVTAGIGLYATAITKASDLVWAITTRFSDMGSELKDLSDQVNISLETLGTFKGVGQLVGVEVEQLSVGLVTFQKNLAGGNDALKALGVTSKDGETALRQTFAALADVNDKTLQTALSQEIFGKSGKAMLAIIKETGGNFDETQDKLREWNYLMSDQAVAIADEFGDKLSELEMRFVGIGNTIGTQTAPAFIAAFDQIAAALDANAVDWQWWGKELGDIIISSTAIIAGFIKAVQSMGWNFNPGAFIAAWKEGMDQAIEEMNERRAGVLSGMMGGSTDRRGRSVDWKPGGDKKAKAGRDPLRDEARSRDMYIRDMLAEYSAEENALKRSLERRGKDYETYAAEVLVLENKRHLTVLAGLISEGNAIERIKDAKERELANQELGNKRRAEERRHKEVLARLDDEAFQRTQRLAELLSTFQRSQADQLRAAQGYSKTALDSVRAFIDEYEKAGGKLSASQRFWLEFNSTLTTIANTASRVRDYLKDIAELTPSPATGKVPEYDPSKVLTPEQQRELGEPPPEDPLAKWRRLADDLSYDITYTIDNAIRAGFEDGIGAGVKEFARGILEMARHEALDVLRQAIRNAIGGGSGEDSGGGNSGLFATLIKFAISAIGGAGGSGAAGGVGSASAGAIGGRAGGGYVPAGQWYFKDEYGPELVKAGPHGDTVYQHGESMAMLAGAYGGQTVNIYAQDVRAAFSRQTITQAKSQLRKLQRGR